MLENFDEEWSPFTDRNEAVYANIPPGQYTFRVRARNAQGFWSEASQQLSVTIASSFLADLVVLPATGLAKYAARPNVYLVETA